MFNLIAVVFMAATGNGDAYVLDHGLTERDCDERPVSEREIVDVAGAVPYDVILWCEPAE